MNTGTPAEEAEEMQGVMHQKFWLGETSDASPLVAHGIVQHLLVHLFTIAYDNDTLLMCATMQRKAIWNREEKRCTHVTYETRTR